MTGLMGSSRGMGQPCRMRRKPCKRTLAALTSSTQIENYEFLTASMQSMQIDQVVHVFS